MESFSLYQIKCNTDKVIDEKACIKKCIQNNRMAQKMLYDTYAPYLYAQCLRLAQEENLARDALQETFLNVFNNLKQFRGDSPVLHWMRRICSHTTVRLIKNYKKISFDKGEDMDVHSLELISNGVLEDIDVGHILEMISNLPPGYRLVFNLYEIEGYSHKEIAGMLEIDEGTSRSQLFKAKKMLKQQFQHQNKEA